MSFENSIADFFYNLIPGILFIYLSESFSIFELAFPDDFDQTIKIIVYISLGLLAGFVFQGMTKIARDKLSINQFAMSKAKEKNISRFEAIEKYFIKKNKLQKSFNLEEIFYLMDNDLRREKPAFLADFFSSRFALWSNISFALILLFIEKFFRNITVCHLINSYILIFLVPLLVFSLFMSKKYILALYDSILKSFYMKNMRELHG